MAAEFATHSFVLVELKASSVPALEKEGRKKQIGNWENGGLTSPQVSLQARAWLVSWRKTVMSLKGVSRNVLHSCTQGRQNPQIKSGTPRHLSNPVQTRRRRAAPPSNKKEKEKRRRAGAGLTARMTTVETPTAAMKTIWLCWQQPCSSQLTFTILGPAQICHRRRRRSEKRKGKGRGGASARGKWELFELAGETCGHRNRGPPLDLDLDAGRGGKERAFAPSLGRKSAFSLVYGCGWCVV